ncbi:hypothetical protein [Nocardia transvalensis]|uniref:hypothetical protein n=1 Tax=Nocardia transvalensis TaxID=37333 RepID=UPI0018961DE6|nr:hypothetical protein [Nocardia transvalensis]MBF6332323.1 hypothetical protein [Nocardia transvalensis]
MPATIWSYTVDDDADDLDWNDLPTRHGRPKHPRRCPTLDHDPLDGFFTDLRFLLDHHTPAHTLPTRLGVPEQLLTSRAQAAGIPLTPLCSTALLRRALDRLAASGDPFTIDQLPGTTSETTLTLLVAEQVRSGRFSKVGTARRRGGRTFTVYRRTSARQQRTGLSALD